MNYGERRKILSGRCEVDLIAITGARRVQSTSDQAFLFSQDRYFYYLTGIDRPDWAMVINTVNGESWLIAPPTNDTLATFEGELSAEEAQKTSGLPVESYQAGWAKLRDLLKSGASVGTLKPRQSKLNSLSLVEPPTRRLFTDRLKRHATAEITDIAIEIADMRMVKDQDEIEAIESMASLTYAVLDEMESNLNSFNTETDVEAAISTGFINHGVNHNYPPIVASAGNAATLHYDQNNQSLKSDSLLLVDVGAAHSYYGADISRTYKIGSPEPQLARALDGVASVQQTIIDHIKPGVTLMELENKALDQLGDLLVELGWIDTRLKKHIRQYFPHSVSHYLGLDVHDVGNYETQLQPGTVLTVEPGLYSREKGFGLRIEDDIVVTAQGSRVLGYNN